ncbi:hypothetical protein D1BOALGB6SA_6915 [Olavius sp. associated proteobacterium Delta 1]|nr:hypothetical protein D1BOALGB6SA_6915 [Olavius sp. associated proteobacterium Delta 1]
MATQATSKPATSRQLSYITRLQKEAGVDLPELKGEINSFEASEIISELIVKGRQDGTKNKQAKIIEPRLGMAIKECFRLWTGLGRDIWDTKRKSFIEETIRTYDLFTEIAEKLGKNPNGRG